MDSSVEFIYELMLTRTKLADPSRKKRITKDLQKYINKWDVEKIWLIHVRNILF